MNIALIGAGYTGLTAAYDLGKQGHHVTLFEASPEAGGLAAGFRAEGWAWPLEKFYHHLFTNDDAIIGLCRELGIGDKLTVYRPSTDLVFEGTPHPFDSPLAVLRYPGLSFIEKMRTGLAVGYLKLQRRWRPFDAITAHEWMQRAMGSAYDKEFELLLRGKFGDHYRDVPMTWLWARFFKRTPSLIYPDGGFQSITDAMVRGVTAQGATLRLATPVHALQRDGEGAWQVIHQGGSDPFDAVIATVAPSLLPKLVAELPSDYLATLNGLQHMGAVVMTVALTHQLTPTSYWLNLDKRRYPMLSLVEHTNMADPRHYGGDHLVYMGDYLPPDHPYLSYSAEQLFEVYEPALQQFNPGYRREWVRAMWLFSASYAQPVPTLHYADKIPPLRTPLPGLYFASMSQVYPWDRGTNYAVELGHRVASELLRHEPRGVAPSATAPTHG